MFVKDQELEEEHQRVPGSVENSKRYLEELQY